MPQHASKECALANGRRPGSRISVPSHRTRPYELPLAKDKLNDSEGLVSVRFDLRNSFLSSLVAHRTQWSSVDVLVTASHPRSIRSTSRTGRARVWSR